MSPMTDTHIAPGHDRDAVERRVRNAIANLRYSGMVAPFKRYDEPFTLEDVASWLEGFGEALVTISDRAHERDLRLLELEQQRDAVRAFFGTGVDA